MKVVLLVADIAHCGAHDILDPVHELAQHRAVGQPDLAADNHPPGGGKGFASDAGVGLLGQEGIKHRIRDAIAQLVGVPL